MPLTPGSPIGATVGSLATVMGLGERAGIVDLARLLVVLQADLGGGEWTLSALPALYARQPLPAPRLSLRSLPAAGLELGWTEVSGARSYRLETRTLSGGWSLLYEGAATLFVTRAEAGARFYRVTALD